LETIEVRHVIIIAAVLALPAAAFADRPNHAGDASGGMPAGMGASAEAVAPHKAR
jgi:hypothetical protein